MNTDPKLTVLEQYYRNMSEIYLAEYQNLAEPMFMSAVAMGVIVEMESDIAEFLKKHPGSGKMEKQDSRVKILRKVMDSFAVTSERNFQIRQTYLAYIKEIKELKEKNSELERLLEIANKTLD